MVKVILVNIALVNPTIFMKSKVFMGHTFYRCSDYKHFIWIVLHKLSTDAEKQGIL